MQGLGRSRANFQVQRYAAQEQAKEYLNSHKNNFGGTAPLLWIEGSEQE